MKQVPHDLRERNRSRFSSHIGWVVAAAAAMIALVVLLSNERQYGLALNSVKLAAATCAISLPLGTILAVLLLRSDLPGRVAWLLLCGSLMLIPLYLQCAGWRAGFGEQGWWTLAQNDVSAGPLIDNWRGAIWVHAMSAVPWVVIMVGASLLWVSPALEEATLLDAAAWRVVLHVTLRNALPGMLAASLWIVVNTAGEITATDLFRVRTLAEDLYQGYYLGQSSLEAEWSLLPALALFILSAIAAWKLCDWLVPVNWEVPHRAPRVIHLGKWRWLATAITLCVLLLIVGIPIASLIYKAGVDVVQTDIARLRTWSFAKCLKTIASAIGLPNPMRWEYAWDFAWSGTITSLAAFCSLSLAVVLAWLAKILPGTRWMFVAVMAICLSLPGPLIGQTIVWLRGASDAAAYVWLFDQTIFAPCVALTIRGLPWCALIMWHAFQSLPTAMWDASRVDGARIWRSLLWVALPQRRAALVVAWFIALAVGLGDVSAVMLTIPPGVDMLSIRIFGLLHYGVEDKVAGICLALISLYLLSVCAAAHIVTRRSEGPFL